MHVSWPNFSRLAIRYRVRLSFVVFGALLAWEVWRGLALRPVFDPGEPVGFVASLLVVFGALLRSWSAGVIRKTRALATDGPYALARHPLYLGSLCIAVGLLLIINEPVNFFVLALLILLVYLPKIRAEEQHLAGLFHGAWEDYKRRTGAFFPKSVPRELRVEWSFEQWKHNREYRGLLTSLAVLVLLGLVG